MIRRKELSRLIVILACLLGAIAWVTEAERVTVLPGIQTGLHLWDGRLLVVNWVDGELTSVDVSSGESEPVGSIICGESGCGAWGCCVTDTSVWNGILHAAPETHSELFRVHLEGFVNLSSIDLRSESDPLADWSTHGLAVRGNSAYLLGPVHNPGSTESAIDWRGGYRLVVFNLLSNRVSQTYTTNLPFSGPEPMGLSWRDESLCTITYSTGKILRIDFDGSFIRPAEVYDANEALPEGAPTGVFLGLCLDEQYIYFTHHNYQTERTTIYKARFQPHDE